MDNILLQLVFENGTGFEEDYRQAATWFSKAAEQNSAEAQYNLA